MEGALDKVLYIGKQSELFSFINYLLSAEENLSVEQYESFEDLVNFQLEEKYSLIICAQYIDGNRDIDINELIQKFNLPFLILSLESYEEELRAIVKYSPRISVFSVKAGHDLAISQAIRSLMRIKKRRDAKNTYIKINKNSLINNHEVLVDIYIKIGESKFLKLYHKGHHLSEEERSRISVKYLNNLFVLRKEFLKFADLISKKMNNYLLSKENEVQSLSSISSRTHNIGTILFKQFGLKQRVLEHASLYIDSSLKILEKEPSVLNLLNDFLVQDGFMAQHSILTAILSCQIAKDLEIDENVSPEDFIIASYFHDITCESEELEMKSIELSMDDKYLANEKYFQFFKHPAEAMVILREVDGIGQIVNDLILHHHEKWNGNGFPRELESSKIPKHSAIFITVHSFVESLFNYKTHDKNKDEIIDEMLSNWQGKDFEQTLHALKKLMVK